MNTFRDKKKMKDTELNEESELHSIEVKSIHNAEHYIWGDHCDGWHLLKTKTLSVIREKMPPKTSEQLHFHHHARQLFYILSGRATFEIEEKIIIVNATESLQIAKGTKHRIANKGKDDLNFLVISEPASHGDRQNVS
ncbi:MAG: cupin domain-containing protein [Bacteroidota bacterium]|nr:cupin domain-containing protein [Bacteroidota bacterium]